MVTCAHCPAAVESASVGFIHSDTHNRQSDVNGHHAATPAFGQLIVPDVDAWKPVDLPVEVNPEAGVANAPFAPVPAAVALADRCGIPTHLVLLDPWLQMTPAERDQHRDMCPEPGCDTCDGHRAWGTCPGCSMYVEVTDAGTCDYCGTDVPLTRDGSDVKVAER